MRYLSLIVQENGNVLLPVECNADSLPELAVFFLLLGTIAFAHDRIEPIEPKVVDLRFRGRKQLQPMIFVQGRLLGRIAGSHAHGHAVTAAIHLGNIVIALQELAHQWHAFFFQRHHNTIDKRRALTAIIQQTGRRITRPARARIRVATKIRVLGQYMAPIRDGFDQHIRPGSHRPGIERQIVFGHARLGVKAIGLPGNGRGERHGQPVFELRILAQHLDAQSVCIKRLDSVEAVVAQIEPGFFAACAGIDFFQA